MHTFRRSTCRAVASVVVVLTNAALATGETTHAAPHAVPSIDEILLFHPTRFPEGEWNPQNLSYQDVWFKAADGVDLHGWFCPHDNPVAAVLYVHGSGGNLSDRRFLLNSLQIELRLSVFIFDFRGYGRSKGVPSVAGALLDAAAAREKLSELANVDLPEVVLMGRSLGGAIAIQLAADEAPRALIVESSFSSLKEMATLHYPNLAWLVPADKLDSIAAIKKYDGPYLQSHGTADTLIPFASGKKLFDAANGPKQLIRIPRGNHNDPQSRAYYRALHCFLSALPKPEERAPE